MKPWRTRSKQARSSLNHSTSCEPMTSVASRVMYAQKGEIRSAWRIVASLV